MIPEMEPGMTYKMHCASYPNPHFKIDHWSEIAPKDLERTLNVVPVPESLNGCHYLITSGHWLDLLASTDRELVCGEVHAVLASCTSHEAALAALRLLQGTP